VKCICSYLVNIRSVNFHKLLGVLIGAAIISGCGGREDTTDEEVGLPAPQVSMSLDLKQFIFRWGNIEGANHYRLLENSDSVSGYTEIWQGTELSHSHIVPLFARISSSYIVSACNDSGCVNSDEVFVSGTLVDAIGYIKASEVISWDTFGQTVLLSNDGKTLVVSAQRAGLVYIFYESNGSWSEVERIASPSPDSIDWSGLNVAFNGDGDLISIYANGVVFIYERTHSGWVQQDTIDISLGVTSSWSEPIFLSDDGNTLAIGVEGNAYIYFRSTLGWLSQEVLAGKGENLSLSDDGSTLASADNNGSTVHIYSRVAGIWSPQDSIPIYVGWGPVFSFGDKGNTLAIGVSEESSAAQGIDGDETDTSAYKAGAVYVYVRDTSGWSRQSYIKASNSGGYDRFGYSVDVSSDGNALVVGAYGEDGASKGLNGERNDNSGNVDSDGGSSGAAYFFIRKNGVWAEQAYLKPTNTENYEEYGRSVAISGDGNTIAVGDDYEASASSGVGSDDSDNSAYAAGAVFLY